MQRNSTLLVAAVLALGIHGKVFGHCEIPCGIYTDDMRITMIEEDCTTIEKSMKQILELSTGSLETNANQLVRWVVNKETHADKIQEIVTQYFLTQRIKPDAENYEKKVTLLHQMLVEAMKCKQTTDLSHVEKLRELNQQFAELYLGHTH